MPVRWVRRTGSARDKADNCGSAARDKADNYVYSGFQEVVHCHHDVVVVKRNLVHLFNNIDSFLPAPFVNRKESVLTNGSKMSSSKQTKQKVQNTGVLIGVSVQWLFEAIPLKAPLGCVQFETFEYEYVSSYKLDANMLQKLCGVLPRFRNAVSQRSTLHGKQLHFKNVRLEVDREASIISEAIADLLTRETQLTYAAQLKSNINAAKNHNKQSFIKLSNKFSVLDQSDELDTDAQLTSAVQHGDVSLIPVARHGGTVVLGQKQTKQLNSDDLMEQQQSHGGKHITSNMERSEREFQEPRYNRNMAKKVGGIKKSKVSRHIPIIGTNVSRKIKAVDKMKWLFISRLLPEVEKEDLVVFLRDCFGQDIVCTEWKTNYDTYKSFKIGLPECEVENALKPDVWPRGALVKMFKLNRKPKKTPEKIQCHKTKTRPSST
ncbi:hypothetical protein J6590_048083 [Homalodisca vitripennis]|nr:hypothetical protein J6590_048083 [Homalodisca vitripennis]